MLLISQSHTSFVSYWFECTITYLCDINDMYIYMDVYDIWQGVLERCKCIDVRGGDTHGGLYWINKGRKYVGPAPPGQFNNLSMS